MFRWRYLDAEGADVGASRSFPDREAAEAWMGEAWADLRARGVDRVALVEGESERVVYRMGLDEGAV